MERLNEFLAQYNSVNTRTVYRRYICRTESDLNKDIEDFTNADLKDYFTDLLNKINSDKITSAINSLQTQFYAVHSALDFIYQSDPSVIGPLFANVPRPDTYHNLQIKKLPSNDAIVTYFDVIKDDPFLFAVSVLAYEAGLRAGEICDLTLADISDLSDGYLHIGKEVREVTKHISAAVSIYLANRPHSETDNVFVTEKGGKTFSVNYLMRQVAKHQDKLNAEAVTLRSLRTMFIVDSISSCEVGNQEELSDVADYTDVSNGFVSKLTNYMHSNNIRTNVTHLPKIMKQIEKSLSV